MTRRDVVKLWAGGPWSLTPDEWAMPPLDMPQTFKIQPNAIQVCYGELAPMDRVVTLGVDA